MRFFPSRFHFGENGHRDETGISSHESSPTHDEADENLHHLQAMMNDQNRPQQHLRHLHNSPNRIDGTDTIDGEVADLEPTISFGSVGSWSRASETNSHRHQRSRRFGGNISTYVVGGSLIMYAMSLFHTVFHLEPSQVAEGSSYPGDPASQGEFTRSLRYFGVAGDSMTMSNRTAYMAHLTRPTTLSYVHERPVVRHPPVYMAIPTVPRAENADYLLVILESLRWSGFPLDHVNVFYNGNPEEKHLRWEQAEIVYSSKGVNFFWNDAPLPKEHPSLTNASIPYPDFVNATDEEMVEALKDNESRRGWRRKECFDFRVMCQHMLQRVYDGVDIHDPDDVARRNQTWIIFNQDDAVWKVEFHNVIQFLQSGQHQPRIGRYDLNFQGLVSVAFRADVLSQLVDYAEGWCDFKPVDWVVWQFFREMNLEDVKAPLGWVEHIGVVSSRTGRVVDPVETGQVKLFEKKVPRRYKMVSVDPIQRQE